MAKDFDYNNFDAPELVKPTPVQDEPAQRDLDRDDQLRVKRRQSSRSRSLDDQFENFGSQRSRNGATPVTPTPARNNTPQRSNNNRNGGGTDNGFDNDGFGVDDNFGNDNTYSNGSYPNDNYGNDSYGNDSGFGNSNDFDNSNYGDSRNFDNRDNFDSPNGYNGASRNNGYGNPNTNGSDFDNSQNYPNYPNYPNNNNNNRRVNNNPNRTGGRNNGASPNARANGNPSDNRNGNLNGNPNDNPTQSGGASGNNRSNSRGSNGRNPQRQQRRSANQQQNPQQNPQQSQQQRRIRVPRTFPKLAIVEFFKDPRTHKFLGVLLLVAAGLITIFSFSHLKNANVDQAATVSHTIAQIAQQPGMVENAGGPVGAKTGHFLITRALGLGSLVLIVYLIFLGLGLLGMKKIKFWPLTFKCLLIGITTSVVLGFVLGSASTGIYWGGEHGMAINGWIHDHMGWIGQAAVSFLLIAAVIIVYSEELARFINRQKEIYEARRQRLAFEQDQEARRQQAVNESYSSIGNDMDDQEYDDQEGQGYHDNQSGSQYGSASQDSDSSQQTYQIGVDPQGAYQPQEQFEPDTRSFQLDDEAANSNNGNNSSSNNGSSTQQGYNLDTDIEGIVPTRKGRGNEALVPTQPASAFDILSDQNSQGVQQGANPQSGPGAPASGQGGIPFAIDEQEIETVPVTLNVAGDKTQENVPMEVSVNDIEAADASEIQPDYDPTAELSRYHKPSLDLLIEHSSSTISVDAEEMEANKQMIISTLRNYGIEISSIEATVGPTVTLFEVVPADGVRISAIKRLEDDIARSLSAIGIRIITPMPGKNTVGLEVPNRVPQIVSMRSILTSRAYQETKARLPMAMGTTITNEVFIEDLTKMPHLLVAGATGQGKSVGLNAIITSLLYKKHPSELKFVMVDPKMVEFSLYSKIEKHFLAKLPEEEDPIITDCDKVKQTLNSLCIEMDDRYALLKDAFVRSLEEYNAKFVKHRLNPEKGHRYLPYIVVVVDEFADLIMMAGKDIEQPIARIAQKARAVGIHLIIATQRPSTNVITGIIKANFPGRIAFKVSQMVDSRTILDRTGANQLIGKGDMLVMRDGKLERVQCAYVSTEEVEAICDDISSQVGYDHAYYLPEPNENPGGMSGGDLGGPGFGDRDSMFEECARFIVMQDTASTSMLQRRFSIGYNKAGRIMDQLEAAGIVSAANGQKPRMVLVDPDQLENMLGNL